MYKTKDLFYRSATVLLAISLIALLPIIAFAQSSALHTGKLPNGLKYYLCHNGQSKDSSMVLKLVLNAGYDQETKDQRQYAHLIEHLAFEGGKHFPPDSFIRHMEKMGLKFGVDINAHTGNNQTVYFVKIPRNNDSLVNPALLFLRDCAGPPMWTKQTISAQGGAVMSEIGLGRNIQFKVELVDVLGWRNNNLDDPDGVLAGLANVNEAALRDYHKKWYRADLMSVVVVGNVDTGAMRKAIAQIFSDLPVPAGSVDVSKPARECKPSGNISLIREMDEKAKSWFIQAFWKRPAARLHAATFQEVLRDDLLLELCSKLLMQRIYAVNDESNMIPGFKGNHVGLGWDMLSINDSFTDSSLLKERAMNIFRELKRIKQHGFRATELDAAKKEVAQEFGYIWDGSNESVSDLYVQQITFGVPAPPLSFNLDAALLLLNSVDLTMVQAYMSTFFQQSCEKQMLVIKPAASKADFPSASEVQRWYNTIEKTSTELYVPLSESPKFNDLEDIVIKKGSNKTVLIHEEPWKIPDMKIIRLSNGAKIIIQQDTSIRKNEIELLAVSNGSDTSGISFMHLADMLNSTGIQPFTKREMTAWAGQKKFWLQASINTEKKSIRGTIPVEQLENALLYLSLYFLKPEFDPADFDKWKNKRLEQLKEQKSDEQLTVDQLKGGEARPLPVYDASQVGMMNLETFTRAAHDRFSGVDDFTFFVSGNMDEKRVRELLIKYISRLPAGTKDTVVQRTEMLMQPYRKQFYTSNWDRADVYIQAPGTMPYSIRHILMLKTITELGFKAMFDRLRTKEGAVYVPGFSIRYERLKSDSLYYKAYINFNCVPDQAERVAGFAKEEIEGLKSIKEGEVFETAKRAAIEAYLQEWRRPYNITRLQDIANWGADIMSEQAVRELAADISAGEIGRLVAEIFAPSHMQELLIYPKKR